MDEFEAAGTSIPRDAVLSEDESEVTLAFLRFNRDGLRFGLHWLPELFHVPMPEEMRKEIARLLRFHADALESGDLEQRMQGFAGMNLRKPGEA